MVSVVEPFIQHIQELLLTFSVTTIDILMLGNFLKESSGGVQA